MRRVAPLIAFVCCAVCFVVAPAADAANLIATVQGRIWALTAHGGTLLWPVESLTASRSTVFVRDAAGVRQLAALTTPDGEVIRWADLGPGSTGSLAVAFARCTDEGEDVGVCSIFRAGLSGARPKPVPGASSERYDEFAPAVWKNRVVFVRLPSDAYSGPYPVPRPLRGLFATSPPVRLARPPACCKNGVRSSDIEGTDLRGRTVAYLATQFTDRDEPGHRRVQRTLTTVVVKQFDRGGHGRSCVVARARSGTNYGGGGPGAWLARPRLDGPYVYWQRTFSPGDFTARSAIHRRLLPTRDCRPRGREQWQPAFFSSTGERLAGLAVDHGRIYYATGPGQTSVNSSIYETPASEFRNR